MADEEEGEKPKGGGGGAPMILVALLVVNTLVAVASLALTVMGGGGAAAPAPAATGDGGEAAGGGGAPAGDAGVTVEEDDEGALVPMDTITLQLRNPEMSRYMRLDLQIEVPSVDDIPAVEKKKARLRDAYINHLADQTYENMRGSRGLERVKAAIRQVTVDICGKDVIRNIYVTNFVVQ